MPYLNRFASADTIVPDPANPQNLNRYSYVLNSPLNFVDPSGHVAVTDDGNGCDSSGYCPSWQEIDEELRWKEENGCVSGDTAACTDENGYYIPNDYDDEWTEIALNDLKNAAIAGTVYYAAPSAITWAIGHMQEIQS